MSASPKSSCLSMPASPEQEPNVKVIAPADVYLAPIAQDVQKGDHVTVPSAVGRSLIAQGWKQVAAQRKHTHRPVTPAATEV